MGESPWMNYFVVVFFIISKAGISLVSLGDRIKEKVQAG